MARLTGRDGAVHRWIAIFAVAILGAVVAALATLAYQHANPVVDQSAPAPVPTFMLGAQTVSPTPTPTPAPAVPRDAERFLSAASGTLWRAVAGACGGAQPIVERSNNAGRTWTDVTPLYRGITQVASLDGLAVDAAEAVGTIGASCEAQALRSFTNGRFWEPYPDVLPISRFVDPTDASVVHLGALTVDAPCADAHGLRALRDTVALVCDGLAYTRADDEWVPLPFPDVAAVAIAGSDVVVVHRTDGCSGLTLTRLVGDDTTQARAAACAEGTHPAQPVALATSGKDVLLWAGEAVTTVALP